MWGSPRLTLPSLCPQYFTFLLLILIAQVAAGVLFYFNVDKVSTPSLPRPPVLDGPCTGQTKSHSVVPDKPSRCRGSLPAIQ